MTNASRYARKQVTTIIHLNHYSAQINWGYTTHDSLKTISGKMEWPRHILIAYLLGDLPPRYKLPSTLFRCHGPTTGSVDYLPWEDDFA
jgi:hypothetical protein